ncbi:MAG TPA: hypothetical protein PL131_00390 [Methylotenera sp.]|nr:hypothetical protein [Methylotenera sp.]HPM99857.1 hypothetical protein [Methylotenera sp.]
MSSLIDRIKNHSQWPHFENVDHLSELDALADDANGQGTLEGYLAALGIYHQLCDEMARLLIKDSQFFIQLSCYPTKIEFPKPNIQMSGQVLSQLELAVEFEGKALFIEKCREMNTLRNNVFHNLTKQTSLTTLKEKLSQVSNLYEAIFKLFSKSHDWFQLCFKDFRKDRFLD